MENKIKWQKLCDQEASIPLFMHGWWMDVVCGKDNWQVVLSYSGKGNINGALAYHHKKKWGMSIITVPPYTPFGGIWYQEIITDKIQSFHSTRKRIASDLINQIPKVMLLDIKLHYSNDNWLPFKWDGYKASVNYTHTIDTSQSMDEIWNGFKGSTRTKILKYKENITIENLESLEALKPFIQSLYVFKKLNNAQYLTSLLEILEGELSARSQRKIWIARNLKGDIEAYLYLVWDKQSAYYLAGGTNPSNRKSNAMYVLFWEAIKFSKGKVNIFDFEGSVIPGIERVFKSFGAVPQPYFKLSKSRSKVVEIARIILGKDG